MYIYAANLLRVGQLPFVDFFDINPPLVIYSMGLNNALARLIGLDPIVFFKAAVTLAFALPFFCATWFGLRWALYRPKVIFYLTALITTLTMGQIARFNFGDRDHLIGLFGLAYFLLALMRIKRTDLHLPLLLCLPIGIFWGWALALKPHFLIYFLFFEFFIFHKTKHLGRYFYKRPELFGSILIPALALLHLVFIDPGRFYFWSTHLSSILNFYQAYNWQSGDSVTYLWPVFLGLGTFISLVPNLRSRSPWTQLSTLLLGSSLLSGLLQYKWFPYHLAPIETFTALVLFGLVFIDPPRLPSGHSKLGMQGKMALLGLAGILLINAFSFYSYREASLSKTPLNDHSKVILSFLNKYTRRGDYVLPILGAHGVNFSLIYSTGLKISSRYLMQYPLNFYGAERYKNGFLEYDKTRQDLEILESEYVEELITDIKRYRPKVIWFINSENREPDLRVRFSVDDYLKRLGIIQFFDKNYQKQEGYGIYAVYTRLD